MNEADTREEKIIKLRKQRKLKNLNTSLLLFISKKNKNNTRWIH